MVEIEQRAPGWTARGLVRLHRIGGEQSREHDEVAEQEDPEPVRDNDACRRRPVVARPAYEFDPRLGGCRHAGRPNRACSMRAISGAEISRSRFSLQPNTIAPVTTARRPRIASHQIDQIAAKPAIVTKKAVTKPIGLLRGTSMAS